MLVVAQAILGFALLSVSRFAPATPQLLRPTATLTWLGTGLLLFAFVIVAKAYFDLGHSFRVHPRPKDSAVLIRTGIYGQLRHPMYSAVIVCCVAVSIQNGSAATIAVSAANVLFYVWKARYEEGLLRHRYAEYPAYQRESWGVLPWL